MKGTVQYSSLIEVWIAFSAKKKQRRKEFTEYKFVDTVRDCFGVLGINS